ncbi:MAG: radical SAM protein [Fervidicoccaceae archaeon]
MSAESKLETALSWYFGVLRGRYPPRYKIAKSIPVDAELNMLTDDELWSLHREMEFEFRKRLNEIVKYNEKALPQAPVSYIDLKTEILNRMILSCELCERKCGTNRMLAKGKYCRVDYRGQVSTYFPHYGEEHPLIPSGTIFYTGCNFRCVYCQNFEISQQIPLRGAYVDARDLALIQSKLVRMGAININHVGGEPTPHAHVIVESFKYFNEDVPQIWNSNFYMSEKLTRLLLDVIDLWLPDFKYWEPSHASVLSAAPRYREVVTRNLISVRWEGSIILRHLVLPGHVECCSKPIVKWLSENMPKDWLVINIMDQYYPTYRVLLEESRWKDLNRRVRKDEIEEVLSLAKREGLIII